MSSRILGNQLGAVVLGVIAAAVVVAFALSRSGGSEPSSSPAPTAPSAIAAFGPHYDGLVARRQAARVPTMMQTMGSKAHFHPLIKVVVNGKPVPLPANIGTDPRVDPMQMADLHTHDSSGTIHVEGMQHAMLGQFMAVWGVKLSPTQLGPYRVAAGKRLRMLVNGRPSTAYGNLKLADGQRILLRFG